MPSSKMIRAVSASVSLLALGANGFTSTSSASRKRTALSSHRHYDDSAVNVGGGVDDPWPTRRSRSPFSPSSAGGDGGTVTVGSSEARSPFSTSSAAAPPAAAAYSATRSASIPFMITNKMKRVLIEELRYTRREVNTMSADRAASIIAGRVSNPSPAPSGYSSNDGGRVMQETAAPLPAASTMSTSHHIIDEPYHQYHLPLVEEEECWLNEDLPSDESFQSMDPLYQHDSPLEQMEEQFGELTEEVLNDDQYGPSLFASNSPVQVNPIGPSLISSPVQVDPVGVFDMGRQ